MSGTRPLVSRRASTAPAFRGAARAETTLCERRLAPAGDRRSDERNASFGFAKSVDGTGFPGRGASRDDPL